MTITPSIMPKRLPLELLKLTDQQIQDAKRASKDLTELTLQQDKKKLKDAARIERRAQMHKALNGSPLQDAVEREAYQKRRAADKARAIARHRKNRSKKK